MAGKAFRTSLRVRYAEVDAQAVVFNAHYLTYLDVALAEYLRHLGLTLEESLAAGFDIVLVRSSLSFREPARLDEVIDVTVRPSRLGRTSFDAAFEILRASATGAPAILVEAENVYVNIDRATGRPAEIPQAIRAVLRAEMGPVEAGGPALFLEIGAVDGWCMVHCPDLPGVGYKAPGRQAALALAPGRIAAELAWAERAGLSGGFRPRRFGSAVCRPAAPAADARIAGEVTLDVPVAAGDTEAIFDPDREPLDPAYLAYALEYLKASRAALLGLVGAIPPEMLDWRPAAGRRAIAEILGHIADAEAFYAMRLDEPQAGAEAARRWRDYAHRDSVLAPVERLTRVREAVLSRLAGLDEADRRRVSVHDPHAEAWSARKVLRRLVWHERYHTRQMEVFLTS